MAPCKRCEVAELKQPKCPHSIDGNAWHLIGLFASLVKAGRVRIELRGTEMWVVPIKEG